MPEKNSNSPWSFLRSTPVLVVSGVLAAQILLFNIVPTAEKVPHPPALDTFAMDVGPWHTSQKMQIAADMEALLKADDTLSRKYDGPSSVDLFVAFFKSQRGGVTPHSPKVCLPGSGWSEDSAKIISVQVPGESAPIPVNRYIVSKGELRNLVLYWYQNPFRVTASEYMSKFYLIHDAFRYHRSDEALVRIIVRIDEAGDAVAEQRAADFAKAVYLPLKQRMWVDLPSTVAVVK
jgi:EpsI family protein